MTRARSARAVVDPHSPHRGGRDDRRAARHRRARSCRACSAIRSPIPRWSASPAAARSRQLRRSSSPTAVLATASASCRTSCCRSRPSSGSLVDHHHPLQDRQPRRTHVDCDLPAGGPCHRGDRQCRHRASGVRRRRPPAARHHLLAAGLAERRDLAARSATLAPVLALALVSMPLHRARARRAGAGRSRSVSQRRRCRAAEADCHRAGVGDDRRCSLGLRRDRLCRHRGAASAAARRSGRRTGCCCRPPRCSARS